jgi:hypothetical protein
MDEVRPYLPQLVAAFGIVVGGAGGLLAAVQTGEAFRYVGTGIFLLITVSLYFWKFHIEPARFR